MRKKDGFTIIELLAVVAIVAILAGLLLTVLSGMKSQARKTRVRRDAGQIVTAWKTFLLDYRRLPNLPSGLVDSNSISILMGNDTVQNPKGIRYLDIVTTNGYPDPWGNIYRQALDSDGNGVVMARGAEHRMKVAIWSDGPDGVANTEDDVVGWSEQGE